MKTYHVKLEPSTVHGWDIEVEAESMSDAIKIAKERHCDPRQVEVTVRPEWLQPKPDDAGEDYELLEYEYQVHDECVDCGIYIFEGPGEPDNDWPWQHASANEQCTESVCYPCAQERLEAGNVCYYYGHFYRDDHHYGCDACKPGDCAKAQGRYYDNLKQVLERAFRLSDARPRAVEKVVAEFLGENEFGLAYNILKTCESHDERDSRFATNMEEAAKLMERGWKTLT